MWFSLTTAFKAKTYGSYRDSVPTQVSEAGGCSRGCRDLPGLRCQRCRPGPGQLWRHAAGPRAGPRGWQDQPGALLGCFLPLPPGTSPEPRRPRSDSLIARLGRGSALLSAELRSGGGPGAARWGPGRHRPTACGHCLQAQRSRAPTRAQRPAGSERGGPPAPPRQLCVPSGWRLQQAQPACRVWRRGESRSHRRGLRSPRSGLAPSRRGPSPRPGPPARAVPVPSPLHSAIARSVAPAQPEAAAAPARPRPRRYGHGAAPAAGPSAPLPPPSAAPSALQRRSALILVPLRHMPSRLRHTLSPVARPGPGRAVAQANRRWAAHKHQSPAQPRLLRASLADLERHWAAEEPGRLCGAAPPSSAHCRGRAIQPCCRRRGSRPSALPRSLFRGQVQEGKPKSKENVLEPNGGRSPALPAAFEGRALAPADSAGGNTAPAIALSQPQPAAFPSNPSLKRRLSGRGARRLLERPPARLGCPPGPRHKVSDPREPALHPLSTAGRLHPLQDPRGSFALCQWNKKNNF